MLNKQESGLVNHEKKCTTGFFSGIHQDILKVMAEHLGYHELTKLIRTCHFFSKNNEIKTIREKKHVNRFAVGDYYTLFHIDTYDFLVSGDNKSGQLSLGNTEHQKKFFRLDLKAILNGDTIKKVIAGAQHTIAHLSNDDLLVCGDNQSGQLGLGHNKKQTTFVRLSLNLPQGVTIRQIAVNNKCSFILLSNGDLLACGDNSYGQLGGLRVTEQTVFKKLDLQRILNGAIIRQVILGGDFTLLLLNNDDFLVCGDNYCGQLGIGFRYTNKSIKKFKTLSLKDILNGNSIQGVVAGESHTIVHLDNNDLLVCGANHSGQLGRGDNVGLATFVRLTIKDIPSDQSIRKIVTKSHQNFMHLSNGELLVCGSNKFGQLGVGHNENQTSFTKVKLDNLPDGVSLLQINAGTSFTIIHLDDGSMLICGSNKYGQLGHLDLEDLNTFTYRLTECYDSSAVQLNLPRPY